MVKKSRQPDSAPATVTAEPEHPKRRTMSAFLRVLLSLLFIAMIAAVFAWFIQYRYYLGDVERTWNFVTEKPLLFAYSYAVIFLLTAMIVGVLWRPFLGAGVMFSIISVITYASAQKFHFRNAPLLPEDFQMIENAGELIDFIDFWSVARLVIGILFVLVGTGLLEHYVRKYIGREAKGLTWWERWSVLQRITVFLLSYAGLILLTEPIINHEQHGNTTVDWLDDTILIAWDQTTNYANNGFVIGFIFNLSKATAEMPADYSETRVAQIFDKYQALKLSDVERKPLDEVVDNLIVILDETFYDPEILNQYYAHTGGDVVPNLHRVFRNYPSGYMYSPEYGGGTANVEFEVFTGLSNYWANTMPYTEAVAKKGSSFQAIPNWARDFGFNTTAIHAYDGNMYKRNIVYPKIGFNTFLDINKMTYTERENGVGYISDSEIYKEILDILKDNSDKHMVGAVTMQNHAAYDSAQYPTLNFHITTEAQTDDAEASFQSLHYADKYLGEFLAELDKLDQKTAVLWFGDHAAGTLRYFATSGIKSERDMAHLTPYFVYTNFELDNKLYTTTEVRKQLQKLGFNLPTVGIDLPTTTPNCLSNTLYNLLNVEKPALMYLLDEVCNTNPILARAYHEDDDSVMDNEQLEEYELLNYDILSGQRYWFSL